MEETLLCYGCGVKLQSEDENVEGYVNPNALKRETILCKRCYQLKHYGKFLQSNIIESSISMIHSNAKKSDIIVLIVDCALVATPIIDVLNELSKYQNLIIVANRYDLYKEYIKEDKLLNFLQKMFKKANLKYKEIFLVNDNIDEIFTYLDSISENKDLYLVGLENAGKTTFINNILKSLNPESDILLTNSRYPGTTINLVKVPMDDKNYLIDSPGIKSIGNIFNYLSKKTIKLLGNDRKIVQTTYQLNDSQSLILSNMVRFDYNRGEKQGISMYFSSMIEIMRCKKQNADKTFKNIINDLKVSDENIHSMDDLVLTPIMVTSKEPIDIVIEGLGFFMVKEGVYSIYTLKGVNVFTRPSMMKGEKYVK